MSLKVFFGDFIIIFLQFVVETEQTSNFTFKTTYHKRLMLANIIVEHYKNISAQRFQCLEVVVVFNVYHFIFI